MPNFLQHFIDFRCKIRGDPERLRNDLCLKTFSELLNQKLRLAFLVQYFGNF